MKSLFSKSSFLPLIYKIRREPVFQELNALSESQWWDTEDIQDYQLVHLKKMLIHANDNFKFYHDAFAQNNVCPHSIKSLSDLRTIPLLEKADIVKLAAEVKAGSGPHSIRATAGTSGVPLEVFSSPQSNAVCLANRHRSFGWFNLLPGARELRFWGRPIKKRDFNSILRNWVLNRSVVASEDFSPANLENIIKQFKKSPPDYIYGYSSLICRFADYCQRSGHDLLDYGIKAVVCTAEVCLESDKEKIKRIFGAPVLREYGCSEVDIISFECPHGGQHIMSEHLILETLPGTSGNGGEAIVTDLNNYLMPLVRYRLGDLVELSDEPCVCGRGLPLLKSVIGRNKNQYVVTPDGRNIHCVVLAYAIEDLINNGSPIQQFKITQNSLLNLTFEFVLENGLEADKKKISLIMIQKSSKAFGSELLCQFDFVERISRTPGKKFSYFESRLVVEP